jgi:hypothetical protein
VVSQAAIPSTLAGLVAAYSFDEGEGPRVSDASGNGNSGYVANAVWSEGRFGSALEFGGKGWVTIRAAQALDATREMTLQAWIYPAERETAWRDVVTRETSGGGSAFSLPAVSASAPAGEGWVVKEKVKLVPGRWTHLATTYDRRVQRVYVNGVLVAVRPRPRAQMGEPGALHVGGSPVWGHRFKGKIDEVRVYNRALTTGEIRADMTYPVACALPLQCKRRGVRQRRGRASSLRPGRRADTRRLRRSSAAGTRHACCAASPLQPQTPAPLERQ